MSFDDFEYEGTVETESKFSRLLRYVSYVLSILIVLVVGFWAYNLGRQDSTEVPVVKARNDVIREKPEDPGGTEINFTDLSINDVLEGEEGAAVSDTNVISDTNSNLEELPDDSVITPDNADDVANLDSSDISVIDVNINRPDLLFVPEKTALDIETISVGDAPSVEALIPSEEDEAVSETLVEDVTDDAIDMDAELPNIDVPSMEMATDDTSEENAEPITTVANELGERLPKGTPLIQLMADTDIERIKASFLKLQDVNKDVLGDKSLYLATTNKDGVKYYRLRVQGFANKQETVNACGVLIERGLGCYATQAE